MRGRRGREDELSDLPGYDPEIEGPETECWAYQQTEGLMNDEERRHGR